MTPPKKRTAEALGPVPPLAPETSADTRNAISLVHAQLHAALSNAERAEITSAALRRTADNLEARYESLLQEASGQGTLPLDNETPATADASE